jgi:hypothetical protein
MPGRGPLGLERRTGGVRPLGDQRRGLGFRAVPDRDAVTGAQERGGERGAHLAESEHGDIGVHCVVPQGLLIDLHHPRKSRDAPTVAEMPTVERLLPATVWA